MFWSSPSGDLRVIIAMLIIAAVISLVVYFKTKKVLLGIFILSLIGNIIFYLNSGSRLFDIYNLKWAIIFTLDYWPYINILLFLILILNLIKNKNAQTK